MPARFSGLCNRSPRVYSPGDWANGDAHFSMGGIHHRLKPTAGEIETRYAG